MLIQKPLRIDPTSLFALRVVGCDQDDNSLIATGLDGGLPLHRVLQENAQPYIIVEATLPEGKDPAFFKIPVPEALYSRVLRCMQAAKIREVLP